MSSLYITSEMKYLRNEQILCQMCLEKQLIQYMASYSVHNKQVSVIHVLEIPCHGHNIQFG